MVTAEIGHCSALYIRVSVRTRLHTPHVNHNVLNPPQLCDNGVEEAHGDNASGYVLNSFAASSWGS